MSADQFTNNGISTLAGGGSGPGGALLAGDTTAVVVAGTGALYPPTTDGPFRALLLSAGNLPEVVICTARTTDTFTLTRAQENTTAPTSWPIGTTVLHNITAGNMTNLWNQVGLLGNNPLSYGAVGNNSGHDDRAGLNAALALGGTTTLPAGVTFYISAPLTMGVSGSELIGLSRGSSQIRQMSSFSGAELINVTADNCTIHDLTLLGSSGSSSGASVAANGIEVNAARNYHVHAIEAQYLNGYVIEATGSSPNAPFGAMIHDIHWTHCADGVHLLGASSQSFGMQTFISNLNGETTDTGDVLFIEDSNDIVVVNVNGQANQGTATGSWLHIKGASTSVFVTNPDLGQGPGAANAPVLLIESGTNGSPKNIALTGGVIQGGTNAISISAGTQIRFVGVRITRASSHGVVLSGSCNHISFTDCGFDVNNQGGAANVYDVNSSTSGNDIRFSNCEFVSGIGSGAGQVQQNLNITGGGLLYLTHTYLSGGVANAYNTANSAPAGIWHCPNVNPVGYLATQPTVGASPWTTPAQPFDVTVYVHGGTISNIQLTSANGGTHATGLSSGAFRLAAGATMTITYSVAPSAVVWFAD